MAIWRLGLWGFVPMSYFCSEINEWWEDCTKYRTRPEMLLWSATSSREIQKNSIFPAQNLQSSKYLNSRTNSVVQEWKHLFLNQAWHSQQQVLQTWKFSKCCRLGNSVNQCVCNCQSDPPELSCISAPRAWLLEKPFGVNTRWQLRLGLKIELCSLYLLKIPK